MQDKALSWIAEGILAAAVAHTAMTQVTTALYGRESPGARKREDDARGGKASYEILAEKVSRAMGAELSQEKRKKLGLGLSGLLAVATVAGLAALRRRAPSAAKGYGLPFGLAVFLMIDEGFNTLSGLTPPPRAFPWQAHARGLVGHLAFGLAADRTLAILQGAEDWFRRSQRPITA